MLVCAVPGCRTEPRNDLPVPGLPRGGRDEARIAMGKRLSKIYTRTGDDGTTGLGDGTRLGKDELRVEAMGSVDEVNAAIGRVLAHEVPTDVRECLERIQHDLFELGAELCLPGVTKIEAAHVTRLEHELDAFNANLPA